LKHRTAKINMASARYMEFKSEYYLPEINDLAKQSDSNHQGRNKELVDNPEEVQKEIKNTCDSNFELYEKLLNTGLARELSRVVMPHNTYSTLYFKMDLRNFFHFLSLRNDSHSQKETQLYAAAMEDFIKPVFPVAYEAYQDYIAQSVKLSRMDHEIVKELISKLDPKEVRAIIKGRSDMYLREKRNLRKKLGL
jgi:thymidylate synthase (FAD)